MSRINCHSAFKHYEMFHNMGGDVINIGSNNTTIFNMGTGFGGGSFWSGLGYGLGNGLGSIFGGLFGGNMGGFGNFGFGMSPFGMGGFGFGMSPFGLGNIFGGGSNRVDSHSDGKGKVKDSKDDKHDCDDPDQKKIIGFMDDLNEINKLNDKGKANEDKVKAKYKEILDAKENQDKYDPAKLHKKENTAAYDKLLNRLQDIADQNGWRSLNPDGKDADKIQKPSNATDANKAGNVKNTENAEKPGDASTVGNTDGTNANGKTAAADAGDFEDKLKQAGDDKGALKELAQDKSLTPEQRAKAKAKFYYPGYSNVTADDLKDETKAKALLETLKTVVDTSDKYDFTNLKNVTATKSEGKWVITADSTFAKGSLAKLKYTFKETVDGELIFVGTKETQHYVLQKNDQGVHLMQYDYHSGHGSYDVKVAG